MRFAKSAAVCAAILAASAAMAGEKVVYVQIEPGVWERVATYPARKGDEAASKQCVSLHPEHRAIRASKVVDNKTGSETVYDCEKLRSVNSQWP